MSDADNKNSCFSCSSTDNSKPNDPFIDLFFSFTGNDMQGCPTDNKNASQLLNESELKQHPNNGDLIIVGSNIIYVYNHKKEKRLVESLAKTEAFFPLTAVSHLAPAFAYFLQIKKNGDEYKSSLQDLLEKLKAAHQYNQNENWIEGADLTGFADHQAEIIDMLNYGLEMCIDFTNDILNDNKELSQDTLNTFLTKGSTKYPIPFNNVMFGTMIIIQLYSFAVGYCELNKLNIDWQNAKTFINYQAGGNISAGGTPRSNFYALFLERVSNNILTSDRIFITPYLEKKSSLGKDTLSDSDFNYYQSSWDIIYGHRELADILFADSPNIPLPPRAEMPGDYEHSKEGDIADFATRLKFSLYYPQESITNCVGFWIIEELYAKNWDFSKINIPGLTSGFPDGISCYPKSKS